MADDEAETSEAESNCIREMLAGFEVYDQHVDVVSAFEWIFTDPGVADLPDTVAHFERFPRIKSDQGSVLTPDFTVLFEDGHAIVGEVARIAQHDNSVEKLCKQLGNYDGLGYVPGSSGALARAKSVDVMLVVEMSVGMAAVRRVISERLLNLEHSYKPSRRPVIVQYSRSNSKYHLQCIASSKNGRLRRGRRKPDIGTYMTDNTLNISVDKFVHVKARRALINDQADALYLATHLLLKTWPSLFGGSGSDLTINPNETAEVLREQYGGGTAADVRRALNLLAEAKIAVQGREGKWAVSRKRLGRYGDRDVPEIIARRICANRHSRTQLHGSVNKSSQEISAQAALFELPDSVKRNSGRRLAIEIKKPLALPPGRNDGGQ